jgi:hypothetical protein
VAADRAEGPAGSARAGRQAETAVRVPVFVPAASAAAAEPVSAPALFLAAASAATLGVRAVEARVEVPHDLSP